MLVGMIVLFGGFVAWILFAANAVFRTPRKDPTERLAALKTAAAALDDPADPVRCHHHDRTKDDPRCETYMKALTAVFGRDL
jgi:hypothetical protein